MPYDFFAPFRERNRFQNIFGQPKGLEEFGVTAPNLSEIPPPETEDDIVSRMSQLYTPETEATERFNRLIEEIPARTEPGALRRIFAQFVGMGGPSTEAIAYGPYHRALADWKTKMDPAQVAMVQERLRNVNERQLVKDIASQEISGRRAKVQELEHERKEREGEQRLEIQRKRAEVYKFKAEHPNWKYIEVAGGNIVGFNPQNPAERVDTGISSGQLTDMDRINLQIEGQKEVATVRGAEARATRATVPGGSKDKGDTELEKSRRLVNKAIQVRNQHPEWSSWIKVEGNNVTITPPSRFSGSTGKATYDKIYKEIYGTSPTETKPAASHETTSAPVKPSQAGKVRMNNPQGKPGWVPANQVETAKKQGYTVVK